MAKKESNYYFDAFVKSVNYADEAARMLQSCLEHFDPSRTEERLETMHKLEHRADGVKQETTERLVREFLPPIEREDIVDLCRTIDDVTDAIDDVLRGLYMFQITVLRPEALEFAKLISRCTAALVEIMQELHNFRKSSLIGPKIIAVNEMEGEGDRLYTAAMRKLYTTEKDPIQVIAWMTLLNRLEKCCDCCEHVAACVEQVILKNS